MIRKIIHIDEEKCIGCGACAEACHKGAIGMIDGKAKLLRDDYCDGLGDCLPTCPVDAISFVEREAAAYDEAAVMAAKKEKETPLACGCPGTQAKAIHRSETACHANEASQQGAVSFPNGKACAQGTINFRDGKTLAPEGTSFPNSPAPAASQLQQWPVQIKLVPVHAPYFHNADLLIAADCTAYAYGNFHNDFIRGRITLVGCPKLDSVDYSEKLTQIISDNEIKSVTVVRMEVPCCGGLESAARRALQASGKFIPWQVVTISTDGKNLM